MVCFNKVNQTKSEINFFEWDINNWLPITELSLTYSSITVRGWSGYFANYSQCIEKHTKAGEKMCICIDRML